MSRPIIKWAGGKTRVLPNLLPFLPKADCLVEPFVGGAAVFLNTDYRRYILADINPDLINLYRQVSNYPEQVIDVAKRLFKTFCTEDGYSDVRDDFNTRSQDVMPIHDGPYVVHIERAAQFLFLNRHGYNGVCRYNKRGGYNVPYGKYKSVYFPELEIRQFAEKANDTKTIFLCSPFERTLQVIEGVSCAIYCDPPYLPASKTANFTQYHSGTFAAEQHRKLVKALIDVNEKCGLPVVISNSDTPTTREIYHSFDLHEITASRSISANAATRGEAKEVIGSLPQRRALFMGFDPAASGADYSVVSYGK